MWLGILKQAQDYGGDMAFFGYIFLGRVFDIGFEYEKCLKFEVFGYI